MVKTLKYFLSFLLVFTLNSCSESSKKDMKSDYKTAADILGNPNYQAISYGGYRQKTRDIQGLHFHFLD